MARSSGTRDGNGGWGGPARGAGKGGKKQPFTADSETRGSGAPDPEAQERREEKRLTDAEKSQALKDHLFNLATTAQSELAQINATNAWLDRHEGKPTQTINNNVRRTVADFTDDELAALAGGGSSEEGTGAA